MFLCLDRCACLSKLNVHCFQTMTSPQNAIAIFCKAQKHIDAVEAHYRNDKNSLQQKLKQYREQLTQQLADLNINCLQVKSEDSSMYIRRVKKKTTQRLSGENIKHTLECSKTALHEVAQDTGVDDLAGLLAKVVKQALVKVEDIEKLVVSKHRQRGVDVSVTHNEHTENLARTFVSAKSDLTALKRGVRQAKRTSVVEREHVEEQVKLSLQATDNNIQKVRIVRPDGEPNTYYLEYKKRKRAQGVSGKNIDKVVHDALHDTMKSLSVPPLGESFWTEFEARILDRCDEFVSQQPEEHQVNLKQRIKI